MKLSLSYWYPVSGVVLDCIDSDLCPLFFLSFIYKNVVFVAYRINIFAAEQSWCFISDVHISFYAFIHVKFIQ